MDIIDHASELNEYHRANAPRAALSTSCRTAETPLIIDGRRCCLDCETPIPEKRLTHMPHAVRCTRCQDKHERTAR